jgi:hypothetical protein
LYFALETKPYASVSTTHCAKELQCVPSERKRFCSKTPITLLSTKMTKVKLSLAKIDHEQGKEEASVDTYTAELGIASVLNYAFPVGLPKCSTIQPEEVFPGADSRKKAITRRTSRRRCICHEESADCLPAPP